MPSYKDQLNNEIFLSSVPKRIISLVPSQTELLFHFDLNEEVVGITKFCVHPRQWFKVKTRVGGTKNVNIEKIKALQPNVIIANKEENIKQQIEQLQSIAPVWVSDVNNLDDAFTMIKAIGELTGKTEKAEILIAQIKTNFKSLPATGYQPTTCYLIWKEPYMTIGGDTFISDMMKRCGLKNIFGNENRYPQITIQQLSAINCQLVLLSSEPFPFKKDHALEIKQQLPDAEIILVDGEMFSWYGSRLLLAPKYFQQLMEKIHKKPSHNR